MKYIPFIIDDKRRTGYLDGTQCWDDDPDVLMDVCVEAQIALQGLLEWQDRCKRTETCSRRQLFCPF